MTAVDSTPALVDDSMGHVESAAKRRQRISAGVLVGVVGVLLLISLGSTSGRAQFALSDAFDEVQLPTVSLPGFATVLTCALLCLLAAAAYLSARVAGRWTALVSVLAGLAVVLGFLTWAASGRDLPFPVSNQLAGTLSLATPLVLGALCGVLCERAGVVNVSIEGQFLAAAFAAAVVGSLTQSVTAAVVAAVLAGVAMAALLALFSINYLVNQVVLGVVLNLLAVGVTGFLFDQLVQPASGTYNSAPVLESIAIPGLSQIPFFGRVLFEQSILAYLAGLSVLVVWLLLYRTTWGLRVRATGEHPEAVDTVGIRVRAMRWSAVLAGGVFAGLGGSFFTLASTGLVLQGVHRRQRLHRTGRADHGPLASRPGHRDVPVLRLRDPDGLPAADPEHPDAEPAPADPALRRHHHRRRGACRAGPAACGRRHTVREVTPPERITQPEMTQADWDVLRARAREMTSLAYAPYSDFQVGAAAVVDDGRIVTGCNVENASYGVGLCAECGLVSALCASGGGRLVAFACVDKHGQVLMPCGRCRQLLWEHAGSDCLIDTPAGIVAMREVLPQAFGPDDLSRVKDARPDDA